MKSYIFLVALGLLVCTAHAQTPIDMPSPNSAATDTPSLPIDAMRHRQPTQSAVDQLTRNSASGKCERPNGRDDRLMKSSACTKSLPDHPLPGAINRGFFGLVAATIYHVPPDCRGNGAWARRRPKPRYRLGPKPNDRRFLDRCYGKRGASPCCSRCTSLKCPYFCIAYRSACRRASGPVKISNSHLPSSSNHSTRHWPGVARSSRTFAGSAPGWLVFVIMARPPNYPPSRARFSSNASHSQLTLSVPVQHMAGLAGPR